MIRKYYLSYFIFFLLLSVVSSTAYSGDLAMKLLVCLGIAIGGAAILGTLTYLRQTKWDPGNRKKALAKSPFKELFQNGFIETNDVAVGKYHDYPVVIYYTWVAGRSTIKLLIFFDIEFHLHSSNKELLNDIINRNPPANRFSSLAHVWSEDSIGCSFEYYFRAPTYEQVIAKAEELTAILIREGLSPLRSRNEVRLK